MDSDRLRSKPPARRLLGRLENDLKSVLSSENGNVYLVSLVFLLLGAFLVSSSLKHGEDAFGLFFLGGILEFYQAIVLLAAAYLRRAGVARAAGTLGLVAVVLMCDPTLVVENLAALNSGGDIGLFLWFGLFLAKCSALFWSFRVRFVPVHAAALFFGGIFVALCPYLAINREVLWTLYVAKGYVPLAVFFLPLLYVMGIERGSTLTHPVHRPWLIGYACFLLHVMSWYKGLGMDFQPEILAGVGAAIGLTLPWKRASAVFLVSALPALIVAQTATLVLLLSFACMLFLRKAIDERISVFGVMAVVCGYLAASLGIHAWYSDMSWMQFVADALGVAALAGLFWKKRTPLAVVSLLVGASIRLKLHQIEFTALNVGAFLMLVAFALLAWGLWVHRGKPSQAMTGNGENEERQGDSNSQNAA